MTVQAPPSQAHDRLFGLAAILVFVLVLAPIVWGAGKDFSERLEHLCAAAGIGLLAIPAYHVSKYGYLSSQLAKAKKGLSPDMKALADRIEAAILTHRDSWSLGKARCFVFGSAFSLAGELFPLTLSFLR